MGNQKRKSSRALVALLIVLCLALAGVLGYILYREYQYGVSEAYYDSLRGLMKGAWRG